MLNFETITVIASALSAMATITGVLLASYKGLKAYNYAIFQAKVIIDRQNIFADCLLALLKDERNQEEMIYLREALSRNILEEYNRERRTR